MNKASQPENPTSDIPDSIFDRKYEINNNQEKLRGSDLSNLDLGTRIDSVSKLKSKVLKPDPFKLDKKESLKKIGIDIPDYSIERTENISGSFSQVQIYVTINKNISSERQRILCEHIRETNSEFSNIMICLMQILLLGKNLPKESKKE